MSAAVLAKSRPAPRKVHVIQGEHAVSSDAVVSMTTILGSCVAACIYDPERGVGGMNHFLLADDGGGEAAMRYGAYAMEVLINDLLKAGASRERLQAKLFGGAKMLDRLSDIGAGNAAFARRFLANEDISVVSESLGGRSARRVEFWPVGGRARQREVDRRVDPVIERTATPADDDVELF